MKGIKEANVEIEGISPLLMSNPQTLDPLNYYTKEIKKITGLHHSKRTDDHEARLQRLTWEGGLYIDKNIGLYIPGINIHACIRDGARISKKGKDVEAGMQIEPDLVPLICSAPKDIDKMYQPKFIDKRRVVVKGQGIMRSRPRFDEWSLKFQIFIIEDIISHSQVRGWVEKAGQRKALGDYRPFFGRFIVKKFKWI